MHLMGYSPIQTHCMIVSSGSVLPLNYRLDLLSQSSSLTLGMTAFPVQNKSRSHRTIFPESSHVYTCSITIR